jgi:hypothetical protein
MFRRQRRLAVMVGREDALWLPEGLMAMGANTLAQNWKTKKMNGG